MVFAICTRALGSVQMNTCGGFLCHAEALKKQKPKTRNTDKLSAGLREGSYGY